MAARRIGEYRVLADEPITTGDKIKITMIVGQPRKNRDTMLHWGDKHGILIFPFDGIVHVAKDDGTANRNPLENGHMFGTAKNDAAIGEKVAIEWWDEYAKRGLSFS